MDENAGTYVIEISPQRSASRYGAAIGFMPSTM
jgi:hypothetical protein